MRIWFCNIGLLTAYTCAMHVTHPCPSAERWLSGTYTISRIFVQTGYSVQQKWGVRSWWNPKAWKTLERTFYRPCITLSTTNLWTWWVGSWESVISSIQCSCDMRRDIAVMGLHEFRGNCDLQLPIYNVVHNFSDVSNLLIAIKNFLNFKFDICIAALCSIKWRIFLQSIEQQTTLRTEKADLKPNRFDEKF